MALTAEQQAQLDIQMAIEVARHSNQMAFQANQAKLEAVRIAQQTLIENRRNQPVDAREVTASDITAFADTLTRYVNN